MLFGTQDIKLFDEKKESPGSTVNVAVQQGSKYVATSLPESQLPPPDLFGSLTNLFFFSFFFAQLPYGPSVSCTSSPLASSVPTSHGATTLQVPHKHKHKHFFVPSTPIYFSPAYIYSLIIRSSPNPSLHTHAALRWIPACTPIHLLYHNHHSACGWI